MASFKKTHTRAFAKSTTKATADNTYWRNFEFPVTVKEFTAINSVDVRPIEPHYIAVTSGPKIDVYHEQTTQVFRSLSLFKKGAYGGKFRKDGQLLIAGAEEGHVKLFNYRAKNPLRIFKGHAGPVHCADFVNGLSQVVSFSDDKSAVVWDIAEERKVCSLDEHKDFIRAGCASPASEHIILSGSYDHTVKMWDTRTGSSVLSVDHGQPVEAILSYPSGGVFVSAGGGEVRVWDTIGGRLLSKLSQHHKTITCLALASDNKRLLSGALDRHIKVYDVSTYSVIHTLDFPAPILSMAIAPGDSTLAVGMISGGSGLISFQHRKIEKEKESEIKHTAASIRKTVMEDFQVSPGDIIIQHEEKEKMAQYDAMLRKFQYSRALDFVLRRHVTTKSPNITVAVFRELLRRGAMKSAVAGKDTKTLSPLLAFITKQIRNPKYCRIIMDVANIVVDVYSDSIEEHPAQVRLFRRLCEEIEIEMRLSREHVALMGAIQMFLNASSVAQTSSPRGSETDGPGMMKQNCHMQMDGVTEDSKNSPDIIVDVA